MVLVASAQDRVHSACRHHLPEAEFRLQDCRTGVECLECLRREPVDVLVLDTALQWGGADGVLELLDSSIADPSRRPLVFLMATEVAADLLYRVGRYRVDDFQIGLHDLANLASRIRKLVRNRCGGAIVTDSNHYVA